MDKYNTKENAFRLLEQIDDDVIENIKKTGTAFIHLETITGVEIFDWFPTTT